MSFKVFFAFSLGLSKPLQVPIGTTALYLRHIEEIEDTLSLQREQYKDNPVHWSRNLFDGIDDDVLCETVEKHNRWVRQVYRDFQLWAAEPVEGGDLLSPEQAATFWHGLELLTVPPARWTSDYYRARMETLYEVMRGRPTEGIHFDEKPLRPEQAGAVIGLFEQFLDPGDLRLSVPRGCDYLADLDHYRWCEKCGAVDDENNPFDVENCRKRGCPLKKENREESRHE